MRGRLNLYSSLNQNVESLERELVSFPTCRHTSGVSAGSRTKVDDRQPVSLVHEATGEIAPRSVISPSPVVSRCGPTPGCARRRDFSPTKTADSEYVVSPPMKTTVPRAAVKAKGKTAACWPKVVCGRQEKRANIGNGYGRFGASRVTQSPVTVGGGRTAQDYVLCARYNDGRAGTLRGYDDPVAPVDPTTVINGFGGRTSSVAPHFTGTLLRSYWHERLPGDGWGYGGTDGVSFMPRRGIRGSPAADYIPGALYQQHQSPLCGGQSVHKSLGCFAHRVPYTHRYPHQQRNSPPQWGVMNGGMQYYGNIATPPQGTYGASTGAYNASIPHKNVRSRGKGRRRWRYA